MIGPLVFVSLSTKTHSNRFHWLYSVLEEPCDGDRMILHGSLESCLWDSVTAISHASSCIIRWYSVVCPLIARCWDHLAVHQKWKLDVQNCANLNSIFKHLETKFTLCRVFPPVIQWSPHRLVLLPVLTLASGILGYWTIAFTVSLWRSKESHQRFLVSSCVLNLEIPRTGNLSPLKLDRRGVGLPTSIEKRRRHAMTRCHGAKTSQDVNNHIVSLSMDQGSRWFLEFRRSLWFTANNPLQISRTSFLCSKMF